MESDDTPDDVVELAEQFAAAKANSTTQRASQMRPRATWRIVGREWKPDWVETRYSNLEKRQVL